MQRNLFVVMRVCSPVVLSYLDAGFEPRCGRKDFWTACVLPLLLAAAETCCAPSTLKRGVKRRQGKPSSVIQLTGPRITTNIAERMGQTLKSGQAQPACFVGACMVKIKTRTRTELGPSLA